MEKKLKTDELGRITPDEFKKAEKSPIIVILDNIRSAANVGSIFRTADAFRVEKILLCGITPSPNREMRKTALGATDSVDWERYDEPVKAVKAVKEKDYIPFAIEQTDSSKPITEVDLPKGKKFALILGHEVYGVKEEVLPETEGSIEIPQFGTKHSLNISVCTGIVLWEFFKGTVDWKEW